MRRLELKIQLGNDAMTEEHHVAQAVAKVAGKISVGHVEGTILDDNGNTVGAWKIADEYRPIVNLETGHESHAIGSVLAGYETLREDPEQAGTYIAKDGSRWIGCSDSIWRRKTDERSTT